MARFGRVLGANDARARRIRRHGAARGRRGLAELVLAGERRLGELGRLRARGASRGKLAVATLLEVALWDLLCPAQRAPGRRTDGQRGAIAVMGEKLKLG